jgi:hypothetical protein
MDPLFICGGDEHRDVRGRPRWELAVERGITRAAPSPFGPPSPCSGVHFSYGKASNRLSKIEGSNPLSRQIKKGPIDPLFICGGERGIRTLDTVLPYTHFPGVLLQPLGHLSNISCYQSIQIHNKHTSVARSVHLAQGIPTLRPFGAILRVSRIARIIVPDRFDLVHPCTRPGNSVNHSDIAHGCAGVAKARDGRERPSLQYI